MKPADLIIIRLVLAVVVLSYCCQLAISKSEAGLYHNQLFVHSINGLAEFNSSIRPRVELNQLKFNLNQSSISLVQYYMATCPHCQEFKRYFLRFVDDIGQYWSQLVKVYVVNCNEKLNTQLCWQENDLLTVPHLRWYPHPAIHQSLNVTDLVPVQARKPIRRDHITLRHKTLNALAKNLAYFKQIYQKSGKKWQYKLPLSYQLLEPLDSNVIQQVSKRSELCTRRLIHSNPNFKPISTDLSIKVLNFIVFEDEDSFVGKSLVADWSNHQCNWTSLRRYVHRNKQLYQVAMLVHYTSRMSELNSIKIALKKYGNSSLNINTTSVNPLESPSLFLWEFEDRSRNALANELEYMHDESFCYCNNCKIHALGLIKKANSDRIRANGTNSVDWPNLNWLPPDKFYIGEERTRFKFNQIIAKRMDNELSRCKSPLKFAGLPNGNPGEIPVPINTNNTRKEAIKFKDEDTTPLRLTDYYKVLDLMVHNNLLAKAHVDGYQLIGIACWIDTLAKGFPFQGDKTKSKSRAYLEEAKSRLLKLLNSALDFDLGGSQHAITCSGKHHANGYNFTSQTKEQLMKLKIYSSKLKQILQQVFEDNKTWTPNSNSLNWTYCSGSEQYLRGYTCTAWLLFHTLTTHEYIQNSNNTNNGANKTTSDKELYKFMLTSENNGQNNHNPLAQCLPEEPESAFLAATSEQLFVDAPKYVISRIINYVRYFLGCTNCAAHFSCAIARSSLELNNPRDGDHLLFLWELHNRVNIRTARTNSEDPVHPKHVVPDYEACRACYLSDPRNETQIIALSNPSEKLPQMIRAFESIQFNRQAVINYLVERYQESAILNDKLRIESLPR